MKSVRSTVMKYRMVPTVLLKASSVQSTVITKAISTSMWGTWLALTESPKFSTYWDVFVLALDDVSYNPDPETPSGTKVILKIASIPV